MTCFQFLQNYSDFFIAIWRTWLCWVCIHVTSWHSSSLSLISSVIEVELVIFFSVCHDLVYANCPYQNTILPNHQTPGSQTDQFLNFRFYLFLGPDHSCHSWFFLVLNDKYHVFFWSKTEIFYMQLRALTWFVEFSLY